uniref:Uncharacterized protein n=1 Tax=Anguilla anguilla TaxID=7936 RepID=A0A0E9PD44_ANGAN
MIYPIKSHYARNSCVCHIELVSHIHIQVERDQQTPFF